MELLDKIYKTLRRIIMNKIKKVLFIGLIFFAVVFSTYQMFMAPTEAGYLSCGTQDCTTPNKDCSGTIKCTCTYFLGGPTLGCYFGAVVFDD
jgi:hypothetical protein